MGDGTPPEALLIGPPTPHLPRQTTCGTCAQKGPCCPRVLGKGVSQRARDGRSLDLWMAQRGPQVSGDVVGKGLIRRGGDRRRDPGPLWGLSARLGTDGVAQTGEVGGAPTFPRTCLPGPRQPPLPRGSCAVSAGGTSGPEPRVAVQSSCVSQEGQEGWPGRQAGLGGRRPFVWEEGLSGMSEGPWGSGSTSAPRNPGQAPGPRRSRCLASSPGPVRTALGGSCVASGLEVRPGSRQGRHVDTGQFSSIPKRPAQRTASRACRGVAVATSLRGALGRRGRPGIATQLSCDPRQPLCPRAWLSPLSSRTTEPH